MKELLNCLENNAINTSKIENMDYKFNNLILDNLILYDNKITVKFRDKMLIERGNILQNYANDVNSEEDIYYIYNSSNDDLYSLCSCDRNKCREVIKMSIKELPNGSELGSILKKQDGNFLLDLDATKIVGKKINAMIVEKIEEQNQYLNSKRIEGHLYKVGEKYLERIWLYDITNDTDRGIEGIEEIEFPKDLYENAKEGDIFEYKDGSYHKLEENYEI